MGLVCLYDPFALRTELLALQLDGAGVGEPVSEIEIAP